MTASEQIRLELVKAILQAEATDGRPRIPLPSADPWASMRLKVDALERIVSARMQSGRDSSDPSRDLAKLDKDIERLTGLVAVLFTECTGKVPLFREFDPATDEIEGVEIASASHIALRPRGPSAGRPAPSDPRDQ